MFMPMNYEKINIAQGYYQPSNPKFIRTAAFDYWMRALYQRLCSVFKWKDLPADWTKESNVYNFFMWCLIRFGYVVVSEDDLYGQWFQPCTFKDYNLYYQPTKVLVNNPLFKKEKELVISGVNKTGCLLQLTPDYKGLFDIISYYAEKLALLDATIDTSIINSRIPYLVSGKTKTAVEALKKMLDKVYSGEPAAFMLEGKGPIQDAGDVKTGRSEAFSQIKLFDKSCYITDDLLVDRQKLIDAFDNEIGIPTSNTDKRERQTEAEITSKQHDACARPNTWLTCLQNSIAGVNDFLGTNISVELRIDEKEALTNGDEANGLRYGELSVKV